ncbi:unnamed protein product [Oncorhynchus mykiss]|uniref:Ionotropic glutamate receptor L-glutamate and glycine-binding domain-containing protein n=1 Tax=Oncorhynchus mykiss TaxID=8022 RepID=A0A060Z586_ONCMY|nr:unnamed protein product [Oncorhynchus mykiss]
MTAVHILGILSYIYPDTLKSSVRRFSCFVFVVPGPPVLSVSTILQEPYTMTQGSELEGYCIDLLAEIAKRLDFKYTVHLVKDGKYGQQDESGNWLGMIGEVVRGVSGLDRR